MRWQILIFIWHALECRAQECEVERKECISGTNVAYVPHAWATHFKADDSNDTANAPLHACCTSCCTYFSSNTASYHSPEPPFRGKSKCNRRCRCLGREKYLVERPPFSTCNASGISARPPARPRRPCPAWPSSTMAAPTHVQDVCEKYATTGDRVCDGTGGRGRC